MQQRVKHNPNLTHQYFFSLRITQECHFKNKASFVLTTIYLNYNHVFSAFKLHRISKLNLHITNSTQTRHTASTRELGDCFGAFADGMLREFPWQEQSHGSLDLSAGDGSALVVFRQVTSFGSEALEDVIHKTVHDRHSFRRDGDARMNLP